MKIAYHRPYWMFKVRIPPIPMPEWLLLLIPQWLDNLVPPPRQAMSTNFSSLRRVQVGGGIATAHGLWLIAGL